MKKISLLILSTIIVSPGLTAAQEAPKDDFLFLGGTVGHTDITDSMSSRNDLTIGLEGVYMKKVVGKFAIGGGLNYNFGLPATFRRADEFESFSNKSYFHDYSLSLLIGGIFDHGNGGRTTLLVGPVYGGRTSNSRINRNYTDAGLADENDSYWSTSDYTKIRFGGYHTLANSPWTFGLNANLHTGIFATEANKANIDVVASVGYAF